MIVTHKHLPRRTFLRGVGVAMGLPLLDAMAPALATAARAGAAPPTRLCFVYAPTGMIMDNWWPKGTGADFEYSRILKPLEPFRSDISLLGGMALHGGNALGDGGGDHARAGASFLTGVHCKKTLGSDIHNGISADQVAAAAVGSRTRFPSLELGCEDSRTVGNCDSGYSCAYTNSISWRNATVPMPPETNPRLVFQRLFGSLDTSLDPVVRARTQKDRTSILDVVNNRAKQLMGTLGPSDQRKMDQYLTAVREVETRIRRAEGDDSEFRPDLEKPTGIPAVYSEYAKLMFDLQSLALQADLTRIVTMMYTREGSAQSYPELGFTDGHHPLSHHRNIPENMEKVTQINCFHTGIFAHFLGRLKSVQDGDGTLLDHSMIVYGSGLSDPNRHLHENLPVIVVGSGGGLKPGRYIQHEKETPMTNLYMSLLDRVGVHPESIGDSTGKVEHLTEI
jgi:hypothetical protein